MAKVQKVAALITGLKGISCLVLAGLAASALAEVPLELQVKRLCVEGLDKPLSVEVAQTQTQRNRGLMQRESLPEDAGMLFLFERPVSKDVGFYMYRTLIPLDVAFADQAGRILAIRTMTPCHDKKSHRCKVYRSDQTYTLALEVNAGFFERHGVGKGDRLFYPVKQRCDRGPSSAAEADSDA